MIDHLLCESEHSLRASPYQPGSAALASVSVTLDLQQLIYGTCDVLI